ncbi:hypothetical protein FKP32DRAFT_994954 [Trametes sanguinea]|nr:hypothetical protein FKP32DRAFT_994954 [Trametes sanguinea]
MKLRHLEAPCTLTRGSTTYPSAAREAKCLIRQLFKQPLVRSRFTVHSGPWCLRRNISLHSRRPRALVVPGALTEADGSAIPDDSYTIVSTHCQCEVTLEVPVSNTTRSLVTSCFCCAVTLPETIGPPRPDALGAWMPVPCGVVYRICASSSDSLVTQWVYTDRYW